MAFDPVCRKCGTELEKDDIAVYKRLINRSANISDCLCRKCLADLLEAPVSAVEEKIAHFKAAGCTLFM